MKKAFVAAMALIVACSVSMAQNTREMVREAQAIQKAAIKIDKLTDKEINTRAPKAARKEAKKFKKQGWLITPGSLPMDKQCERSYELQARWTEVDGMLDLMYMSAEGMSIGENYDAAKMQATEFAKLNLAGQLESRIAAIIDNTIANEQLSREQAASIAKTVSASKNLISQRLGRVIPVVEMYRVNKKTKNKEVLVRLFYNVNQGMNTAKQVIREELEKEGNDLHKQLDELLGF